VDDYLLSAGECQDHDFQQSGRCVEAEPEFTGWLVVAEWSVGFILSFTTESWAG